ncbi:hypothetical protein C8J57DRAFT_1321995 [Mycena rebaudengoi]|nr:hypothetical protein C8J57DRAFT_1321995 [Mycena rebaudengoi]
MVGRGRKLIWLAIISEILGYISPGRLRFSGPHVSKALSSLSSTAPSFSTKSQSCKNSHVIEKSCGLTRPFPLPLHLSPRNPNHAKFHL